ncbi:MAG: hypothetical protein QW794_07970 [Thermosphaera sp.]
MKEEVYVWEVPFAADGDVREKFVKDVKKLLAKYDVNFVEIDPEDVEPAAEGWECRRCQNPALIFVEPETGEVFAAFELL